MKIENFLILFILLLTLIFTNKVQSKGITPKEEHVENWHQYLEREMINITSLHKFSPTVKTHSKNFSLNNHCNFKVLSMKNKVHEHILDANPDNRKFKNNKFNFAVNQQEFVQMNFGNMGRTNYTMGNDLFSRNGMSGIHNPYMNFIKNNFNSYTANVKVRVFESFAYNVIFNQNNVQPYEALNTDDRRRLPRSMTIVHEFDFFHNKSTTNMQIGSIEDNSFFNTYRAPEFNKLNINFISVSHTREVMPTVFLFTQYIQAKHFMRNQHYDHIESNNIKNFGVFKKAIFMRDDKIALAMNVKNTNKSQMMNLNDFLALPSYLSIEYAFTLRKKNFIKLMFSMYEGTNSRFTLNYKLL